MTPENNIRKPFVLLALVALLAACSSSAVETTPTAVAQPTHAPLPTEIRIVPTQPTATATVAPTSPATTMSAARPAILDVFPLSVGATWVYILVGNESSAIGVKASAGCRRRAARTG